jgi:hypothetical protein
VELGKEEIDELLARHRLHPNQTSGSASKAAAEGGVLASVYVGLADGKQPVMHLAVGRSSVASRCPLDHIHAQSLVAAFRRKGLLPEHPSFEHMLVNLLARISEMYFDGHLETLSIGELRLHQAAYHLGRIVAHRSSGFRLKPRLEPNSHDRRAVFTHRHGDDVRFPK